MSSDWFYHAPQRRRERGTSPDSRPEMPPMSQIPGLSDLPAETEPSGKPSGVLIRDTDSKYIKLAKMGGRKNLLYFKQGAPSSEPKKYPVPEWWGFKPTDQNEDEDLSKPRAKPSVPDYMVHQAYMVSDDMQLNSRTRARVPFGQDGQSHWSRDANNVRNPNNIRSIDVDKLLSETGMPFPNAKGEEEPAMLSKLLNYGYQRDWLMEREEQRRQDEERKRLYSHNLRYTLSQKGYDVQPTLSQAQIEGANQEKPAPGPVEAVGKSKSQTTTASKPWRTTSKTAHHGPVTNSSLYKMKRFEKIPSRVNAAATPSVAPVPEVC
ncbi:uncharacterized protein C7orf57-like isoform X3 [Convolutriloba macropyga]|uniref:uncharacterized protein C7orf57-like isoform X3 n=1 Tax=Convolutriloba macropyga TaxID=536237 RepID=UPI003F51DBFA